MFAHPDSDPSFTVIPFTAATNPASPQSIAAYAAAMKAIGRITFDVVQNNSIHFLPPILARRLKWPMATTLHTPPYRSHRWTAGLAGKSSTHVYVAISEYMGRAWQRYVGETTVIPNGIALEVFPFVAELNPANSTSAVWYGRITPDKGTHYAAIAARDAGFSLKIAGPVEDDHYFATSVEPLLSQSIQYVGHTDQHSLARLIGDSTVGLVTPEWEEPFGLVCVEMLACGTPVAAFDSGAIREILSDQCARVVPKADIGALARVLGEAARKQRTACRARAEDFSLSRMVNNYAKLYQQMVKVSTSDQRRS